MILLLALLLAQPTFNMNLNQQPIISRQNGARLSTTRQWAIDCQSGMTCAVDGGVLLLSSSGGGGGGGSSDFDGGYNVIEDEGLALTKRTTLNFTGAGVSCVDSGGKTVCTITGGAGGAGNFAEVDLDFAAGDELLTVVVTGQSWVTAGSRIVCAPTLLATSTRLEGEEDAVAEGLVLAVHSRVPGVGFSITASPRVGYAYGVFKVHCTGD